jgi:prepilin-type N-terminal cleavage/methylation domain-containing protein
MKVRKARQRAGFTLIELLVVIAIIGVLAALILPGVQSARAAARRAECLNNMRNIGVAFHNFHAQKGYLPSSGKWDVTTANTTEATSNYPEWTAFGNIATNTSHQATMRYSWALELMPFLDHSDIYDQWDFRPAISPYNNPIGNDLAGRAGFGSYWINSTQKLPNGGNAQLANTNVKVLTCPSDPTTIPGKGNLSYVVNGGYTYHWRLDYLSSDGDGNGVYVNTQGAANIQKNRWSQNMRNSGVFFLQTTSDYAQSFTPTPQQVTDVRNITFEGIKDGNTTTVMLSENINAGPGAIWETPDLASNWACPHPWNTSFFVNGAQNGLNCVMTNTATGYSYNNGNNRGTQAPPITPSGREGGINGDLSGANEGQFPYVNSGHAGIVHVLMCDGSAKPVSDNLDARVWARLVSPNGSRFVRPSDGLINGLAQEDPSGLGFTQNPIQENIN